MFLLLAVVVRISRDMMSVWFSHTKFKQMWRTAIWITGLTVAGALCGVMISRYRTVGSFDGVFDDPTGLGGRALLGGFLVGVIYSLALLVVSHVRRRTLQVRNEELRRQVELPRLAEAVQRLRKRIDTKPPTAPPDLTLLVKSLLEQAKPTEKLRWILPLSATLAASFMSTTYCSFRRIQNTHVSYSRRVRRWCACRSKS